MLLLLLLADNLLLTAQGRVKLSDFGVSCLFDGDDDSLATTAGSAAFMAPEMCTSSSKGYSGKSADIW